MEFLVSVLVQCLGYVVSELILSTFFFFLRLASGLAFHAGPVPDALPTGRLASGQCCVGLVVFCLLLLALCSRF
ncbi:hypothetical protein [Stutzerimonas nitrititolerans]|uniref:hypothetical protein n=1 Tax=Stutzerimonas nitrititolerans TaxID=2482751 RepID=UPI003F81F1E4